MPLIPHVYLVPHFPGLLRPSAGGRTEPEVIGGLGRLGGRLRAAGAEVVVILAACWDEEGPFQVDNGARHKTLLDFHGVDVDLRYSCAGWVDLGNALHENGLANGLPVETVHRGMDHSAAVPASILFPEADRRIVPLSCSERGRGDYQRWGAVVRETCRGAGATCVILAGGSLTYDPTAFLAGGEEAGRGGRFAPAHHEGAELDRRVLSLLEAGDWEGLARLPREQAGPSGQHGAAGLYPAPGSPPAASGLHAGLRHLWFLEGVLGAPRPGRVLEYGRLPGVGSALVEFTLPAE